ncbi:hypothetical protein B4119_4331 [Parageobacillus caldoxylosilyticus]|uniref:Uncharacterized protein n=1 Tax=Saccharococcus caldoxylosilyticus TaxID=81408 RepID=A0A150L5A4_9BACL|nr:hypothetical protein B4119_4331 [Parageobacillus caldoxylosilyticus]
MGNKILPGMLIIDEVGYFLFDELTANVFFRSYQNGYSRKHMEF